MDSDRIIGMLRGLDRAVIFLILKEGWNQKEIANCFGFTESWAALRIKGIQERISKRIKKEARSKGQGKREMEGILPKEKGGVMWRVEQFETEGLEIEESW